jgi:hypothetical protein
MNNENSEVQLSSEAVITVGHLGDMFDTLNDVVAEYAQTQIHLAKGVVFKVMLDQRNRLFDMYLNEVEKTTDRQWHNCACCRNFLRRFGGLVTMDPETGVTKSLLWNEAIVPEMYVGAITELRKIVEKATVDSVFYPQRGHSNLGVPEAGGFNHFAVSIKGLRLDNGEAPSYNNVKTLSEHLDFFTPETLKQAKAYFTHDKQLSNQVRDRENLEWFAGLAGQVRAEKNTELSKNIIWYAVATESPGRLVYKNNVVGVFMQALQGGEDFEVAKRQFSKMAAPENRMRPTVAPTANKLAIAEKIFADLNLASAMRRRYLRIDEIRNFSWKPTVKTAPEKPVGLFAHIVAKDAPKLSDKPIIDGGNMSWKRFVEEVMPKAMSMSVILRSQQYAFGSFTTAVDPDAEPLLRWDKKEERNPVSSYAHTNGLTPLQAGLDTNVDIPVLMVIPSEFHLTKQITIGTEVGVNPVFEEATNALPQVVIVKGGDRMRSGKGGGLAIFPENLRPELFEVRQVIEAFSNAGSLEEPENGFSGIHMNGNSPTLFSVETEDAMVRVLVDRPK